MHISILYKLHYIIIEFAKLLIVSWRKNRTIQGYHTDNYFDYDYEIRIIGTNDLAESSQCISSCMKNGITELTY